jgi:DNA-binding NarL/FixJ family response regulator
MGISGYVTPDLAPALILRALYLVSAGGVFIPPNNIHLIDHESNEGEFKALPDEQISLSVDHLTPRERQVVSLLRTGRSNKIIAKELALQESTVKVHIKNIMDKLKAESRTHAVFLVNNSSNHF